MFLIYLAHSKRTPPFRFFGASGRSYSFRWSDAHRLMILEGKELSVSEFEKLAPEIFGADRDVNTAQPIPKFLGGSTEGATLRLPPFSGGELMKIASRIGELQIENEELRSGLSFTSAPVVPAEFEPSGALPEFASGDFDPDEAPAGEIPAPATPAQSSPRRTPPPLPPPVAPAAVADGAFYDPDELPADMAQIS